MVQSADLRDIKQTHCKIITINFRYSQKFTFGYLWSQELWQQQSLNLSHSDVRLPFKPRSNIPQRLPHLDRLSSRVPSFKYSKLFTGALQPVGSLLSVLRSKSVCADNCFTFMGGLYICFALFHIVLISAQEHNWPSVHSMRMPFPEYFQR